MILQEVMPRATAEVLNTHGLIVISGLTAQDTRRAALEIDTAVIPFASSSPVTQSCIVHVKSHGIKYSGDVLTPHAVCSLASH